MLPFLCEVGAFYFQFAYLRVEIFEAFFFRGRNVRPKSCYMYRELTTMLLWIRIRESWNTFRIWKRAGWIIWYCCTAICFWAVQDNRLYIGWPCYRSSWSSRDLYFGGHIESLAEHIISPFDGRLVVYNWITTYTMFLGSMPHGLGFLVFWQVFSGVLPLFKMH